MLYKTASHTRLVRLLLFVFVFFLFPPRRVTLSTKRTRLAHFKEMHVLKLGVNKALSLSAIKHYSQQRKPTPYSVTTQARIQRHLQFNVISHMVSSLGRAMIVFEDVSQSTRKEQLCPSVKTLRNKVRVALLAGEIVISLEI